MPSSSSRAGFSSRGTISSYWYASVATRTPLSQNDEGGAYSLPLRARQASCRLAPYGLGTALAREISRARLVHGHEDPVRPARRRDAEELPGVPAEEELAEAHPLAERVAPLEVDPAARKRARTAHAREEPAAPPGQKADLRLHLHRHGLARGRLELHLVVGEDLRLRHPVEGAAGARLEHGHLLERRLADRLGE